MAEIDAEVRRRRATGEFPPDLEAELDAVFARFAPPGALGDDLDALLARAEDAASIDVDAPVDSARPVVPVVKKVIRKSTAWYQRHLATQVSALGGTLVGALRNLADRIERLEQLTPGIDPTLEQVVDDLAPATTPPVEPVLAALASIDGRVLHAAAGDGSLVRALVAAGCDAYGVDPRRDRTAAAVAAGFDIRGDAPVDHLARLPSACLGAVVLSGFVDRAPVGMQVAAFVHAARAVAPGGVVVVAVTPPEQWQALADGAVAELSPGRPLGAATWRALARRQELVVEADSPLLVARRPHR
jgi:hypothetical protein